MRRSVFLRIQLCVVMESGMPPINEKKSRLCGRLCAANTFIHSVPWPQASFVSFLTDLAGIRRPWLETDGRSGTAGVRQMAACVSPGPRLAASLKKDGPK